MGQGSIIQKIDNSDRLRKVFQHYQEFRSHSAKCKNLHAAKHRVEVYQKPAGRMILHLEAVLATAMKCANDENGDSEILAWLSSVDAEE